MEIARNVIVTVWALGDKGLSQKGNEMLRQNTARAGDCATTAAVLLVVGDQSDWCGPDSRSEGMVFIDYSALTCALLDRLKPEMVMTSLFGRKYDALDVARKLSEYGYSGSVRAVSAPLPRPELIKREIKQSAPGIDFDIVSMPAEELVLH